MKDFPVLRFSVFQGFEIDLIFRGDFLNLIIFLADDMKPLVFHLPNFLFQNAASFSLLNLKHVPIGG